MVTNLQDEHTGRVRAPMYVRFRIIFVIVDFRSLWLSQDLRKTAIIYCPPTYVEISFPPKKNRVLHHKTVFEVLRITIQTLKFPTRTKSEVARDKITFMRLGSAINPGPQISEPHLSAFDLTIETLQKKTCQYLFFVLGNIKRAQ